MESATIEQFSKMMQLPEADKSENGLLAALRALTGLDLAGDVAALADAEIPGWTFWW
ncbi:MAG: hypothetical protein H6666_00895 [Ardenticatenaceae bacterium]|nr:hypothetical protein [Anaerolineales bacterium]MCB8916455.1 hypothetical protein [Ardenticatenaceae bacterium]